MEGEGSGSGGRSPFLTEMPLMVYGVAAGAFLLEMALSARYGYHRDELYFIQCFKHLSFGYVDQPPLTPIVAGLGNAVFRGNLAGFRLAPALAMAGLVILAGSMARELGGDRFTQGFAALSVAVSAEFLAGAHLVSPTIFDWLVWAFGFLVVLRLLRTGNVRLWLWLGLIVGVGLENKWNVAFFAFGLLAGLLLTPERRLLRSWWALLGGAVALAIWAPDLIWQAAHGWPQFTVFSSLQGDAAHNRSVYLPAQLIFVGFYLVPVWVAGLLWLFRNPKARPFRSLAWMFLVVLTLIFVLGGKAYYPGGLYTVLLAAGAIPSARFLRDPRRRVLKPAPAIALLVVGAALMLPIALPVLPARMLATVPVQSINYDLGEQIGWPRFVATVAEAFRSVPASEQMTAVILTANYGEAGAIDRYGPLYGLPLAASGDNNFWLWGPPREPRGVTVAVNLDPVQLRRYFADVHKVATFTNGLGVSDDEQGVSIYVCRGQREPWSAIWPSLQSYR